MDIKLLDNIYNKFEDKVLSKLIQSLLVYKSDYDHNHDDKYIKKDSIYSKEEIDNILMSFVTTLDTQKTVSQNDNTAEIRMYISELKVLEENINKKISSIEDFNVLKTQIDEYKKEYQLLKADYDNLKAEFNALKQEVAPLIQRRESLVYSADNIINKIRL